MRSDTGPLRSYTHQAKEKLAQRNQPSLKQQSSLSELQKFVKRSRITLLDPILAHFENLYPSDPESDAEELDPEELRKEQERAKIRELKKRKIRAGGLKLPSASWHGAAMGVFVRHDIEDETMDVDIFPESPAPPLSPSLMDVDEESSQTPASKRSPAESLPPPPRARQRQKQILVDSDERRPTKRSRQSTTSSATPKSRSSTIDEEYEPDATKPPPKPTMTTTASGKPKPETYKQAWSASEQNLLEQLLEQIPDGEKYRCVHFSQLLAFNC